LDEPGHLIGDCNRLQKNCSGLTHRHDLPCHRIRLPLIGEYCDALRASDNVYTSRLHIRGVRATDAHDRLPTGLIAPGKRSYIGAGLKVVSNLDPLRFSQRGRSTEGLALCFRPRDSRIRAFNKKVSLEFRNGIQDSHGHPARCTCEVRAAQSKTVNPNATRSKQLDGRSHIHSIATKSVKLRDDNHVVFFDPV
jgi:hypothetical protein